MRASRTVQGYKTIEAPALIVILYLARLTRFNLVISTYDFPSGNDFATVRRSKFVLESKENQICESCEIHPGCTPSSRAASSFQMSFCKRCPSVLLTQSGTQNSLILQPDRSFPWLSSPATKPCKIVRLPSSAVRAIMARSDSCMILVKVLASRPKPVEQRPGATMFTTTPVRSTEHKAANWRTAHSSTSFVRAYLI